MTPDRFVSSDDVTWRSLQAPPPPDGILKNESVENVYATLLVIYWI